MLHTKLRDTGRVLIRLDTNPPKPVLNSGAPTATRSGKGIKYPPTGNGYESIDMLHEFDWLHSRVVVAGALPFGPILVFLRVDPAALLAG